MLLDVLSGLGELKICVAYELDGKQVTRFPSHVDDIRRVVPVYEALPGWKEEVTGCRGFSELPANAQSYLGQISELVGRPIEMVSVGPERDQTIVAKREPRCPPKHHC
jgi:adenylosuccinate synthase